MIISRTENNEYGITGLTENEAENLCDAIDNAPLNLKRNLYELKTRLEGFLALKSKHQPVKK